MIAKIIQYKSYLIVLGFTVLGHGLGFAREMSIAREFGASGYADGLLVGLIPITLYLSIWGSAYVNAALTRIKTVDNTALIAASLRPLLKFGMVSCAAFYVGAEWIVNMFPGLVEDGRQMAIALIKASSVGAILVSIAAWGKGLLHLQKRFSRASTADIMPNLGFIVGILVLFPLYGVYGVAAGGLVGYALQFLFAVEFKSEYFKVGVISKDTQAQIKLIFRNMMLATLSYSVVYIDSLVDRYFAASLEEGSIAILSFGHKLMTFPLYTIIFAITTVLFPNLIQLSKNRPAFNAKVKQVYWVILAISLFVMTVSIALDEFLVALLFNYGAFDTPAVEKTASVFTFYMLGFAAHAYVVFGSKVRYALEDFRVPVIAGLTAACINLVLDILLVKSMGREGLALATSMAAFCNAGILIFYHKKRANKA